MSLCAQPAAVNPPSVLATSYRERFGDEAADYGCASIPHVVVKYHRRMDMTYGEWDLITQLFSFKWTQADPYPSITTLAERLAISARQVHALITSAQQKGFLQVVPRPGHSNAYDLAPVIEKATRLEEMQRQGVQKTSPPPPLKTSIPTPPENQHTKKKQVPRKNGIERSVPPTPVAQVMEPPTAMDAEARPQARFDADYSALVEPLAAIGDELGDQAHPLASVTRAYNLMTTARLDVASFLALVQDARVETLSTIQARRREKPPKPVDNPMAYYFGVLARLTRPDTYPPQWRSGPPRRQPTAPPAPAPSSPPSDTWEAITAEAREIMTAENIATWFTTAHQLDHAGDVLTVAVPNAFHHRWLDVRYRAKIEQCAQRIQPGLQLAFVVQEG